MLTRPIVMYGLQCWTLSLMDCNKQNMLEREILRNAYGPIQESGTWRIRYNDELHQLYKETELTNNQDCQITLGVTRAMYDRGRNHKSNIECKTGRQSQIRKTKSRMDL